VLIWIMVQVLMIRQAAFLHYLYWGWGGKLWLLTSLPGVRRYYKLES